MTVMFAAGEINVQRDVSSEKGQVKDAVHSRLLEDVRKATPTESTGSTQTKPWEKGAHAEVAKHLPPLELENRESGRPVKEAPLEKDPRTNTTGKEKETFTRVSPDHVVGVHRDAKGNEVVEVLRVESVTVSAGNQERNHPGNSAHRVAGNQEANDRNPVPTVPGNQEANDRNPVNEKKPPIGHRHTHDGGLETKANNPRIGNYTVNDK